MKKKKLLFQGSDWDVPLVDKMWKEVDRIGKSYGLNYDEPQIELVTADQIMMNCAAVGLPTIYEHWSFGKDFVKTDNDYKNGHAGLPYELIINSTPPRAYLMENNSATTQLIVLAHACVGHSDFFKNNYLFKKYTHPEYIVSYCNYARKYMKMAEQKLGTQRVEVLLDAAHSLRNHSVDTYLRTADKERDSAEQRRLRQIDNEIAIYNPIYDLLSTGDVTEEFLSKYGSVYEAHARRFDTFNLPEENILYFIEKNSPALLEEEREILRIVRNIAQYFFPQPRTKVMNEGWATFWHRQIVSDLWEEGLIDEGAYLEFIHLDTGVRRQADCPLSHPDEHGNPPLEERGYTGFNPYALGYSIWNDIKRICENPTEEDKKWFPMIANTDWLTTMKEVREDYMDSSFILQFLSPKVVRDFKLFGIHSDPNQKESVPTGYGGSTVQRVDVVKGIHDDEDFRYIRQALSNQYNMSRIIPNLQVIQCDLKGDRELVLQYTSPNVCTLSDTVDDVLSYIEFLWGYPVSLHLVDNPKEE